MLGAVAGRGPTALLALASDNLVLGLETYDPALGATG